MLFRKSSGYSLFASSYLTCLSLCWVSLIWVWHCKVLLCWVSVDVTQLSVALLGFALPSITYLASLLCCVFECQNVTLQSVALLSVAVFNVPAPFGWLSHSPDGRQVGVRFRRLKVCESPSPRRIGRGALLVGVESRRFGEKKVGIFFVRRLVRLVVVRRRRRRKVFENLFPMMGVQQKFSIIKKYVVKNEYGQRIFMTLLNTLHRITDPCTLSLSGFYTLQFNIIYCNTVTKLFHHEMFLLFNICKMFHKRRYLSGNFSRLPSWHSCSSLIFHHLFHK